jgi:NAD(P)-dependent dehydrogenase (short-subunit alcohol dehydrogenase family)/uncharacterized ubiquitin-like protein YukD
MGVGIEDVLAVKALQYGIVPAIANYDEQFEPDPELGNLNLSHGGSYPVQYALRLGAGFGSQIAMTLLHKVAQTEERVDKPVYQRWLAAVSGYESPEMEIVQHTLRVRNDGQPTRLPVKSDWQFGQPPIRWVEGNVPAHPVAVEQPVVIPAAPAPSVVEGLAPSVSEGSVEGSAVSADSESIKTYILRLVSKKTGYPVEMLDPGLDLEADLGVDTVKQAELFAAMREHYNVPRRDDLRLADYNTLEKVVQFFAEAVGGAQVPAQPISQPAQPQTAVPPTPLQPVAGPDVGVDVESIKAYVLGVVSEKTGYPIEMLDPGLDLEADLGVDTVKQAELFATMREHYNVPRRDDLHLADYNTLEKVVRFFAEAIGGQQVVSEPVSQPAQPQTATTPSAVDTESIKTYVLGLVSEKTGYPVEMLDLGLDLEADLGVDTIKQAELFAAMREHYNVPRRDDLRLADYNTLEKVILFFAQALEARQIAVQPATPAVEQITEQPALAAETKQSGEGVIKRRVPVPVLRPRLNLCRPTSVTLGEDQRVLVVAGNSTVGSSLARRLRARKVQVLTLNPPGMPHAMQKITAWLKEGPIHGVYFLPALEVEPLLAEMTPESWQQSLETRAYDMYQVLRALPDDVFLVCATRCGGLFGYTPEGATAPLGGLVSGFAKAVAMERPQAFIKVVDFAPEVPDATVAACLLEETLFDPAVAEVGWVGEQRFTIANRPIPLGDESNLTLDSSSVFLVSGGSGGITGRVVLDLARQTQGRFYLVGIEPVPDPTDADLQKLRLDHNAFKQELIKRAAAQGEKVTPVQLESRLAALDRLAALLDVMDAIRQTGAQVTYMTADVTNAGVVRKVVETVVKAEGRVDVLLHAAGIERSHKLEHKPFDEFRLTVSIKADGFFNLFKSLEKRRKLPRAVIFFASIAGRCGNSGQTDYSAANDFLDRLASAMRRQYPGIKTIALDWGPWGEVGMASRGSIPELMQRAGIEMMPPGEAAPMVYRELVCAPAGEAVLCGALGTMERTLPADGGLDLEKANAALTSGHPIHIMLSRVTGMDINDGVILETDLDPSTEPFLRDHAMDGTPLLPGVMGIEGFSVAARHIASVLGSAAYSFRVERLEDIRFLTPFKFYRSQPRRVTWKAQAVNEGGGLVAYVTLESAVSRMGRPAEKVRHFSGKVYLTSAGVKATQATVQPPAWDEATAVHARDIYKLYFHGPVFQVLEGVYRRNGSVVGKLRADQPPITASGQPLVSTPVLVELCLQTAGLWEAGKTGLLALPHSIGRLTIYKTRTNGLPIYAEVHPGQDKDGLRFDARVVDAKGRVYLDLDNYRTSPLPYAVKPELLDPFKVLVNNP